MKLTTYISSEHQQAKKDTQDTNPEYVANLLYQYIVSGYDLRQRLMQSNDWTEWVLTKGSVIVQLVVDFEEELEEED